MLNSNDLSRIEIPQHSVSILVMAIAQRIWTTAQFFVHSRLGSISVFFFRFGN